MSIAAMKGLIASGPLAVSLFMALVYQTRKLERAEKRVEELHERVLDVLKGIGRNG